MRLMSFAATTAPFYRREKTVTRRLNWLDVEPGELLCGVLKGQGLKPGQSPVRLAIVRVTDVRRERLGAIRKAPEEVLREGFPGWSGDRFIDHFCQMNGCRSTNTITRIAFEYLPGGRYAVPGFCRVCGCFDLQACVDPLFGPCGWVDERGRATLHETTLCSHCYRNEASGGLTLAISAEMERA